MGEVYRARDLKLNRDVAIKVLPAFLSGDAERLARFSREAQVLASLNHPNIAHIHGFEENASGDPGSAAGALVMELVEGPTLADRIAGGPLPLEEALPIARQIVAALDAAHAQGIVHRDLKPANIKVRDDGTVKVLDFGLAKLASPDASGSGSALANSPTLTAQSTQLGMIVGTAAYMAPEQAKGKPVDKRADIWAFGAVLFEMLAGRPLFEGDTVSEVLASVLKDEPRWTALPVNTPPAIRRVLARCLERDLKRRLHDIADVLPDLEEAERAGPLPRARDRRAIWFGAAGVAAGAALTAVVLMLLGSSWRQPSDGLRTLSVLPPAGQSVLPEVTGGAVAPDGQSVVFVAGGADAAAANLWLRSFSNAAPRVLPGTKGALEPFWSPDSSRLGFFADGKLKTIRIDTGTITTVCDAPYPRGGTWSASGLIVFAPSNAGGLMKVSAEGGDPEPATTLDASRGETAHRFPYFVPDGRHFLFVALPGHGGRFEITAASVDDNRRTIVTAAESGVVYAPQGYLLYARQNGVAAQAFDARRLNVSGEPITLSDLPHNLPSQFTGAPPVSVSANGMLVYYDMGVRNTRFVWYDMTGKQIGTLPAPDGFYQQISIAPGGRSAAVVRTESATRSDIWLLDLERGGTTRLTNGPGQNVNPSWSPDGKRVAFVSDRGDQSQIYVKALDGQPERQLSSDALPFKGGGPWAKDGSAILFSALDPKNGVDLWILPTEGDRTPKPYVRTPFNETSPSLSPDGRYAAYLSDETGQQELYIQSFPTPGEKYRVTSSGAAFGGWLPDGRIAYGTAPNNDAYFVRLLPGTPLRTSAPQPVGSLPQGMIAADLMPDLSKMLVILPAERNALLSLSVVQNWPSMLRAIR